MKPVSGAGADISVGKKILALTATSANRNTRTINKGAIFWRMKVIGWGVDNRFRAFVDRRSIANIDRVLSLTI